MDRYGQANSLAPPQVEIGLSSRIDNLAKPLQDIFSVLTQIEDRLFGCRPRAATDGDPNVPMDGLIHALNRAESMVSDIQSLAHQIRERL